ncbi:MAG: tRNA (N6-isopentenyl adenosine(37)-C2)-methylthiotransferase MiaB [Peptococcaceae bacterium]|nr:tRNA (N6-isopentenyl adenosine(37)-C2)-methylthiotransferase MiaB [Peptococcaceae bacterium]
MNENDTEKIHGILESMGHQETENLEKTDIFLINTCCVRETAENKVFGLLGRLKKIKESRPSMVIGVGGCMTQLAETAEHIRKRFPFVNLIYGTGCLHNLPDMIDRALAGSKTLIDSGQPEGIFEAIPTKRKDGIKAWVPVIYGCDNFCTYCIVPFVRGRERSRRSEDIIAELKELAEKGYKEVTLLGQNVNSYGKDFKGSGDSSDFSELILAAEKVEGIERIRFMTSHPKDFNDRLIEAIGNSNKICEHIHIPVQSGSNRVLALMNRGYDRDYYLDLVARIRKDLPKVSITSDIMVGFPGETDQDFMDTLDLLEKVRYDTVYTFVYNRRKGTPAEKMINQVSEQEKRRRIEALIKMQNEISLESNSKEIGSVYEILIEGASRANDEVMIGRTKTNKLVLVSGLTKGAGEIIRARIVSYSLSHLDAVCLD